MKDTQLLVRLNEALNGHIAINGDDGPNLFRDAKKELERLYEIENLAQFLFYPINHSDTRSSYRTTTAEEIRARLDNGRKLGIAVGAIKPNDGEASK